MTAAANLKDVLGPLRQIGYVVHDVDAAAQSWVDRFGIGPWRVKHGIELEGRTVSIASSYSGGIEVELIAQSAGPPSMYTRALERGPGAQHVCFFPSNYDAALEHMLGSGMTVEFSGQIGDVRFCYASDGEGQVVEIADLGAESLALRAERSAAAAQWTGSGS